MVLHMMKTSTLKRHLIEVAEKPSSESTIKDVYAHFSLLTDIDESERQEKDGEMLTKNQV